MEAFTIFKVVAETESGKKLLEVLTDNVRELSQGEICRICEEASVKLNMTVLYHPGSNSVAERTIGVLTNTVRTMLHNADLLRVHQPTQRFLCDHQHLPNSEILTAYRNACI